jgi:flagellar P-ring protein precursor FlgI
LLALALIFGVLGTARGERIKDIARVGGVRSNQLIGYGLVVGLDGSGDSNGPLFTGQSVAAMMERFGVTVPAGAIKIKNVAAVIVTADLPAFVRNGSALDVQVSSLGDAKSLQGGTLLQTPLRAGNGGVYAVAQGAVSVGGFTAGGGGSSQSKNHVTAGRVPGGALVEQEVPTTLAADGALLITLHQADFTTAARVAQAINRSPLGLVARAADAGTVEVALPGGADPVLTVAGIETLPVTTDVAARVVVNERTGTVVIGGNVTVSACAIAHGSLSVSIRARPEVSQPNPLSKRGKTVVVPNTRVDAREEGGRVQTVPAAATVDQVVRALNALGVTPRDLIAILQALKGSGSLKADLEIQ